MAVSSDPRLTSPRSPRSVIGIDTANIPQLQPETRKSHGKDFQRLIFEDESVVLALIEYDMRKTKAMRRNICY